MSQQLYYLGFSAFSGIGPVRFSKLIDVFGSAEGAWKSSEEELSKVLGEKIGTQFIVFRRTFDLEEYSESLRNKDIHPITLMDTAYPSLLKKIKNPPFVLYVKGNIRLLEDAKAIGIVGTRKVTEYGRQVTEKITAELVQEDFVIVSGLALGVDGIAHKTALQNSGKTIAVLGSGVDICTPAEHEYLYNSILEKNGCIVSSVKIGERPIKGSFPARNRIVAGLSLGIVVTEGAADSGALITAKDAEAFGRPVFSVPGPITSSLSQGTNSLLKKGAILVTSSREVLDRLDIMETQKSQTKPFSLKIGDTQEETKILQLLANGSLLFDEIVRTMTKDSKEIGSLLSLMELKGMIKSLADGKYSL